MKFMVSRYQNSGKEDHQRFMKFVELKVTDMESRQEPHAPRRQQGAQHGYMPPQPKTKAAAKAASSAGTESSWMVAEEDDEEAELEMYIQQTMTSQVEQSEMMGALQQRMLHMESTMSRLINHLENQAHVNHLEEHP